MPAIYEHPWQVTEVEIDGLGHVGNVEYLRWLQAAAIAHSAAQGWPTEKYFELGAGWVVRSHQIEYLMPAHLADEIVVRTWVANLRGIRSLRRYEVWRPADQTLLAKARTEWVFISFATRQPRRVPDEIKQAFDIVGDQEAT
ncbi:MAG: thioesterase family protein [Pirellulaceae bacterium]|nr:thioesterase family protein [Pirellulaceae bacterium]